MLLNFTLLIMILKWKEKFVYNVTSFSFYGASLIVYSLFFVLPAIIGFLYSVTSWNGLSSELSFIGLENYKEVFTDRRFFSSIFHTLIITVIQVFFFNFVVLILAVMVERVQIFRIKLILRSFFFFPYVLSYVIVAAIWQPFKQYRIPLMILPLLMGPGLLLYFAE